MLYQLAVETGLRAGELRSLTRASFSLDRPAPTVTVAAAYSKRHREDTLPLRSELAEDLRQFLSQMAPATTVFRMPDRKQAAEMFRDDIEAAGIVYQNDAGKVADFHSLRHTFISNLAAGGVHPKVAQSLARHSTITLTMDRYTHSYHGEQTEALKTLPDLSSTDRKKSQATGTVDADPTPKSLARCLAQKLGRSETPRDAQRFKRRVSRESVTDVKSTDNALTPCQISGGGGIRTHGEHEVHAGFQDRCIQPLCHPTEKLIYPEILRKILVFSGLRVFR